MGACVVTITDRLAAVLAAVPATQTGHQAPRPRFSRTDDCERALVLDFAHPRARDMNNPRYILAASVGTVVGEVLERAAKSLGAIVQERVVLAPMTGNLDVRWPDRTGLGFANEVWDWKVVGDKAWKRVAGPRGEPNRKHVVQVNAYAVATNARRWALLYLRGRSIFGDELEWRVHTGAADPHLALAAQEKWQRVEAHVKAGTLPVIPDGYDPARFPCGWCGHKERCHGAAEEDASDAA